MACTEAESIGRSAQMNVPRSCVFVARTRDLLRSENGVEMMTSEAAECRTVVRLPKLSLNYKKRRTGRLNR